MRKVATVLIEISIGELAQISLALDREKQRQLQHPVLVQPASCGSTNLFAIQRKWDAMYKAVHGLYYFGIKGVTLSDS